MPVTAVLATAGNNQVTITWTPPANAEAMKLTDYFIKVTPDLRAVKVAAPASSAVVSGLRNGTEYEFTVYAATADGSSEPSEPVRATPSTGMEGEVAGLIVKFEAGTSVAEGQLTVPGEEKVDSVDLQVADTVGGGAVLVDLSESVSLTEAKVIAGELASSDKVEWAEPDQFLFTSANSATGAGGDTKAWNLTGTYGVDARGDQQAGKGATVAVIDTGITGHPDLEAIAVSGYDFVSSPDQLMAARQTGAPPVAFDGDYADTGRFGNVGRDSNPSDPGDWRDVAPNRSSSWHGTQIAGVISSIVPAARIQPIRALSWRGGLLSDIAASITWASGGNVEGVALNATPAKVINMSFSTEVICPVALQDSIDAARKRGSILVAAAGNAGDDAGKYAPGNCSGVITVGATGSDGSRAPYSNFGSVVDVSAPGGDGFAPVPTRTNTGATEQGDAGSGSSFGTSIAAAHVSAGAALLVSKNSEVESDDAYEILAGKNSVKNFAAETCDVAHPDYSCGSGILSLVQISAACAPTTTTYTSGSTRYRVLTFTATGSCDWTEPAGVTDLQALVIGGGGGGAGGIGGGGGGGRYVYKSGASLSAPDGYVHGVTVGAGGSGGSGTSGAAGSESSFSGWRAPGGGGGGATYSAGGSGGSGGGSSCGSPIFPGGSANQGSPEAGQGNAGGSGSNLGGAGCTAGGGGGAASAGTDANGGTQSAGNGGAGQTSSITGSSVYYAGGGGGGVNGGGNPSNASVRSGGSWGNGGVGGGGSGGMVDVNTGGFSGGDGTANSGGGGGGASNTNFGGNGGSGVVILSYSISTTYTLSLRSTDNRTEPAGSGMGPISVSLTGSDGLAVAGEAVTFAVTTGNGSVANASTTTNSSGIAYSGAWVLGTRAGTNVVTITAGGETVTITATGEASGSVSGLAVVTAPVAGASGALLTTQPSIAFVDAYGNPSSWYNGAVYVSIVSGAGGALSGSTSKGSSGGVATFTNLALSGVSSRTYTLQFSGGPFWLNRSVTVTGPGSATAAQSTVTSSPSSVTANGTSASTITVTAKDSAGNLVRSQSIYFEVTSGTATLSASTATTNASGVATITAKSAVAGAVTISAYLGANNSGTLITQTAGVTFAAGAATAAQSTAAASPSSVTADGTTTSTVTATAKDANGNAVANQAIYFSLSSGTGTLSAGPWTTNSSGVATATVTSTTAGSVTVRAYLGASASGTLVSQTATVTFTAGAATQILITTQPVAGASGGALTTQPVVRIADAQGNTVTSSNASVDVTASGGVLGGTTTKTAVSGVVTFTDLTFAGLVMSNYTLTFALTGLTPAVSTSLSPTSAGAATAAQSTVVASSSSVTADGTTASTVTVTAKDTNGNVVSGQSIFFAVSAGAATLSTGPWTTNSSGVATATVRSTTAGAVTIRAYLGTSASGTLITQTASITFTPGAASKVLISTQPISGVSGALLGTQPIVRIADAQGNTVTSSSAGVTVTSSGGTLAGTIMVNAVSGVVTFTDLNFAGLTSGSYTLTFASTGLTPITSSSLTPTGVGAAYTLAINAGNNQSATMGSTTAIAPSVIVRDSGLNPVSGTSVTFAQGSSGPSSELLGLATGTLAGADPTTAQSIRAFRFMAGSSVCLVSGSSGMDSANATGYSLNIYANNGGTVGTLIGTLDQSNAGSSIVNYSGQIALTSGTTYWASVRGSTAGYLANVNLAPNQPSTSWTWFAGSSNRAWSSNGGSTWNLTTFADHPQISLSGSEGACGSSSTVTTDSSGIATFSPWTLSMTIGTNALTATSGSLSGSPVTFTATGTARPITITAEDKSVTFGSAFTSSYAVSPSALPGSDSISGVTYTFAGTGATVYGPTTTAPTGAGTYSVTPSSAVFSTGSASNYTIGYTAGTVTIGQQSQTITFAQPSAVSYGAAAFSLVPTASSGLTVTLTSNSTGICTVAGTVVTIVSAGTCSLTSSQAGNTDYTAATSVTRTFAVNKINQTTLAMTSPSTASYGQSIALASSGGSGTGTLSYGVVTGTCNISGSTLTLGDAGSMCTVRASKLGDNNYNDITSANQTIAIARAGQSVAFTSSVPAAPLPNGTYTPTGSSISTVTGSASGLSPVFTIPAASAAKCSISGGEVTFLATGSCVIEANSAQTTNFTAATTASQTIVIGSLNQNITFAQPANVPYGTSSVSMGATASSGLTVNYTLGGGTTNSACTVSTLGAVTILAVGTCEVTAAQAGDSQYAAASSVTRAFSVVAAVASAPTLTSASASDQSITVGFTAPGFTGGVSITAYRLVATPVTAGTIVTTTACTSSPCTITGLVNGTGYTVTVAAINSAGTGAASAASTAMTPATAAFAVSGLSATPGDTNVALSWTPLTNAQLGGGAFTRYVVSKRVAGSGPWIQVTNALTTQSTSSYTVTGLDNGTSYDFQLVAITSANTADIPGNTAEVVQYPSTTPTAPRSVTTLASTATDIQVSWQVPLSDGGSALLSPYYAVTITSGSTGAITPVTCVFASVTDRFCSASNLTSGAAYSISVSAINRMGTGNAGTAVYNVPSSDATLSSLVLTGAGGAVALDPVFTPSTFVYEAEVTFSSSTITLTPTTTAAGAVVDIDGDIVASGFASLPIPLEVGTNEITILVTASDPRFDETYELTITRLPAPPAGDANWAPSANLPVIPPVAVMNGSVTGAVIQAGQTRADVTMSRSSSGAGWQLSASDFSMSVETLDAEGRPVRLVPGGAIQVPQGGSIVIEGAGYLSSSDISAFAIPRATLRAGSNLVARADTGAIYLGSALVNASSNVSARFIVPSTLSIGDYVFQINGLTERAQVRSVSVLLEVIAPQAAPSARAGKVRAAAFFAGRSAMFTESGKAKLRAILKSIPQDARSATISIIGVSVSMDTRGGNIELARQRAVVVADYLEAHGVKGKYNLTINTSYDVRGSADQIDKFANADQPATTPSGKPLTTATISFVQSL